MDSPVVETEPSASQMSVSQHLVNGLETMNVMNVVYVGARKKAAEIKTAKGN